MSHYDSNKVLFSIQSLSMKNYISLAQQESMKSDQRIVRHIMVEVKPAPDIKIPDCVVGIDTHLSKIESFSCSDINLEEGSMGFRESESQSWPQIFITNIKLIFEYKSLAESINDKAKEKYQIVEVQKAILSEILGETDVGEMRTLVRKKLNKMFKRGQRGADSTRRLDKTLEQILREAMDDMSIQEKCSEDRKLRI
ncbi:hypothetical protein CFP56_001356 [Quercus suber]|uniref:Uncharacterized protein n=1 Tax=Quercus suber TaxID=58331 RepID=A0AAW0LFJ6_QUESU